MCHVMISNNRENEFLMVNVLIKCASKTSEMKQRSCLYGGKRFRYYAEIKQKHYIRTILYRLTRKVWSLRRNKYSNVFDSFFVAQSLPTISLHFLSWETLQAMSAHFLYPTIATKYKLHAIYIYANHTQPPYINQKPRRWKFDLYI